MARTGERERRPDDADAAVDWQRGLSSEEVRHRLQRFGPNATADVEPAVWRVLLGKFIAPVPCLLEAAIVLQIGLHEYVEASVIGVLLVFNALLGFFQEGRAKTTLAALRSRLALNASVLRDGAWAVVPVAGLVPGDIIKLTLGSVVPADVRIGSGAVQLDQSMLTGEAMPVEAGAGYATFAGALVRRGEAMAEVTATGEATRFGRAAELVRTARVTSTQQKAVLRVVVYLAGINGAIAAVLIAYAVFIRMPAAEIVPLALIAVLSSIPVALPATFTLAGAVGAQALGRRGVLPTRLSAVDEAASMNLLCADKTGTLTSNTLKVAKVVGFGGAGEGEVLMWARLASSDGGLDPVDAAVRAAAACSAAPTTLTLNTFIPFDPAVKMAEAMVTDASGVRQRVVKGAFGHVLAIANAASEAAAHAAALEADGFRVLGVARGAAGALDLVGLLALSDPPRPDAAACLATLADMGVRVVMVTGDARDTAASVARAIGLQGPVAPAGAIAAGASLAEFSVFAGVLPEDKFALVKALQGTGDVVGMCGDGANDAPALRQAQLGIAVSTATDVAKSAAGLVLTEPGLDGIVAAVAEGRVAFQRILTYTLRSMVHKVRQVIFLAVGLWLTGHAILTPLLVVMSMITGDFLAMSSTTDNVRPSKRPNTWKVGNLTLAGAAMGLVDLVFCVAILLVGRDLLRFDLDQLRTLTLVTLVFNGEAIYYVVRERRRIWSSMPSRTVMICSLVDVLLVPGLALGGVLMAPLPLQVIVAVLAAAVVFGLLLDVVKSLVFRLLDMR